MEQNKEPISCNCSMAGIRPAMADLPYPPNQISERNQNYAQLLSVDYCGAISELSAITQYINNENRLVCEKCPIAKTILEIAVAEMMHLQKLGELINLLGGAIDFTAKQPNGRLMMWTPAYLKIPANARQMILADIESENAAINQYRRHMSMIKDIYVNRVLARIIKDEEYHIMLLRALMEEL